MPYYGCQPRVSALGGKTADLDDKEVIDKLTSAVCYWFGKLCRMVGAEGQSAACYLEL